jgi:transposase
LSPFGINHTHAITSDGALVLDNLSAHREALRELPYRLRRRLRVHWTPTNSSWLNPVESYVSTLKETALNNTDYRTPAQIDEGLLAGVRYLNADPTSYRCTKM